MLFGSGEGDEAAPPSLSTENESIDASSPSLEAPIATHSMRGDANGGVFTTANKYLFADLLLFGSGEGDEATSPSLATENESIDASSPSLEAPIATHYMRGVANGGVFTTANKYLSADLLFFTAGEGDEATSPSFASKNAVIEASGASLEALIASLLPACGTAKEATFPTAINLLIAVGSLSSYTNGERAKPPSFASIGTLL